MTPGTDCDFTLAHTAVNAGASTGFFLAAERGRKSFSSSGARAGRPQPLPAGGVAYADFGPGPREWKLRVRFGPDTVDYRQAAASGGALADLRAYYALKGAPLTLGAPTGETHTVYFLALEEHVHPPEPGSDAEITLIEAM